MITAGLTEALEQEFIRTANMIGQPFSEPLYNALARLFRLTTTDLVLVDHSGRVFLTQRPPDDVYDAGRWHFPGTVLRATDKSNADSLLRIGKKELKLGISTTDELFLGEIMKAKYIGETFSNAVRGPEVNRYFVRRINSTDASRIGDLGKFVDEQEFNDLDILQHHRDINIWVAGKLLVS